MTTERRKFSVCIPAYNRARHLPTLLDSIFSQDYSNFEVVICEDKSREREEIASIAQRYALRYPDTVFLYENGTNLGYDGNIRNLVEKATGEYCFFMGNDDLMCPGALANVAELISRYDDVGMVLKSYAWFDGTPDKINQEVRYFTEERFLAAGRDAVTVCFRRSGVISGYIIHRDAALAASTDRFDGTLYYQMHLTAVVLSEMNAVFTPKVLVLCRNSEPPEFGNSGKEKGKYVPGSFTPEARLNMIGGALSIIDDLKASKNLDVVEEVRSDYANYFYPYIRDQFRLPIRQFFRLYRSFGEMGFYKYPMFHLYFLIGYVLGDKRFDSLTRMVRQILGRSPQLGNIS